MESLSAVSLTVEAAPAEILFSQGGRGNICCGQSSSGAAGSGEFAALKDFCRNGERIQLPCDFADLVENLRRERYRTKNGGRFRQIATSKPIHKLYYFFRGGLPFRVRRPLQKFYFRDWTQLSFPACP